MMKQQIFSVLFLLSLLASFSLFSMGCSGVQTVGQAAQIEAGEVVRLHVTRNDTFSSDAFDTDDTQEISEYLQPVLRFQLQKGQEVDLETLEFKAGEYAGYLSFRSQKQDGTSVGFFFTLGGGGELPWLPSLSFLNMTQMARKRNGQFMKSKKAIGTRLEKCFPFGEADYLDCGSIKQKTLGSQNGT